MNEMYESSVRPRPAPATGDVKQGMLINCAAYHGGCRVADIDLDQAHKADTSDGGFVWIGLHEPDEPLLVESIDNLRDLLAAALEAHLLLSSVEQNGIIKIFSVAAVVLMPPTLIASIYGMNFKNIPELEWPYGYSMALVLMLIAAVLPYLFFKWKKWL